MKVGSHPICRHHLNNLVQSIKQIAPHQSPILLALKNIYKTVMASDHINEICYRWDKSL